MKNSTIGFIGGGRVTRFMLRGFKSAGIALNNILVSDVSKEIIDALKHDYPEIKISESNAEPAQCDYVFLALHPPALGPSLSDLGKSFKQDAFVISLAPKFTLAKLQAGLGGFNRLARMIPNAPSVINAGFNPIAFSSALSDKEQKAILSLVESLGQSPVVPDEQLESFAIITAMGPTYFWFQFEHLRQLAVKLGMEEQTASLAIHSMLEGTVKTYFDSGLSYAEVVNLIPVKPLAEQEDSIRGIYNSQLEPLYAKLTS